MFLFLPQTYPQLSIQDRRKKELDPMEVPRLLSWYTLFILASSLQHRGLCRTYQIGDLHAWGIPSSSNPQVYTKWSQFHNFTMGDTLFFLYPPSQDSVIQVTKDSFHTCNLKDPILAMDDGNSLFNITKGGHYYFTSGVAGHCEKSQKLHISVGGNGSYADDDSAYSPDASPGPSSYPTNFGSIPMQQAASSSSSPLLGIHALFMSAAAAATMFWYSWF